MSGDEVRITGGVPDLHRYSRAAGQRQTVRVVGKYGQMSLTAAGGVEGAAGQHGQSAHHVGMTIQVECAACVDGDSRGKLSKQRVVEEVAHDTAVNGDIFGYGEVVTGAEFQQTGGHSRGSRVAIAGPGKFQAAG